MELFHGIGMFTAFNQNDDKYYLRASIPLLFKSYVKEYTVTINLIILKILADATALPISRMYRSVCRADDNFTWAVETVCIFCFAFYKS